MWAGGFLFALYALRVDFRLVRLVPALVLALVLFNAIVSTGCTILVSGRLLLLHIHRDEMSVTDEKCSYTSDRHTFGNVSLQRFRALDLASFIVLNSLFQRTIKSASLSFSDIYIVVEISIDIG